MIEVIVYGDCPIERSGFHRFLVHVTNGEKSPGRGAIYATGQANCPIKAIHRAIAARLRRLSARARCRMSIDAAARDLPLWNVSA